MLHLHFCGCLWALLRYIQLPFAVPLCGQATEKQFLTNGATVSILERFCLLRFSSMRSLEDITKYRTHNFGSPRWPQKTVRIYLSPAVRNRLPSPTSSLLVEAVRFPDFWLCGGCKVVWHYFHFPLHLNYYKAFQCPLATEVSSLNYLSIVIFYYPLLPILCFAIFWLIY